MKKLLLILLGLLMAALCTYEALAQDQKFTINGYVKMLKNGEEFIGTTDEILRENIDGIGQSHFGIPLRFKIKKSCSMREDFLLQ